jgi:orotidine-5'-phosphate decarboxylase
MVISQLALAVDLSCKEDVQLLLKKLNPKPKILKVGLELTTKLGVIEAVNFLNQLCPESNIFLDLKFHDIPNTVGRAIESLLSLNNKTIKYTTIHALGGSKMLQESIKAARGQIDLIGVTVLTSHSEEEINKDYPIHEQRINLKFTSDLLAKMSYNAGLRWLVASSHECKHLKSFFPDMKIVTPGVRLLENNNNDQIRVMTPKQAIQEGSDMLVIGRPVYQAKDPQRAWTEIILNIS